MTDYIYILLFSARQNEKRSLYGGLHQLPFCGSLSDTQKYGYRACVFTHLRVELVGTRKYTKRKIWRMPASIRRLWGKESGGERGELPEWRGFKREKNVVWREWTGTGDKKVPRYIQIRGVRSSRRIPKG